MVDLLFSHPGLRMAALATLVGGPAAAVTVFAFARLARRLSGWRRLWLVLGGVSAAAGVWTTHFVAVLASHEGLPQGYGLIAGLGGVAVLGAAVIAFSLDANRAKGAMQSLRDGRDAAVEQARLAQMAQDIAGLGHWRVDLATDEVAWSRQMYAIYGLSPDAPLKLRALIAMTHPEDARAGAERLADQRKTGRAYPNTSTRIIAKDGSTHWLQGSSLGEFDADGKLVALVGTLLDVTPQRRLEEDLRAARAEAEAAAAVKAEFLANMSHELRTPLTSILGFSDLLHEQADLSVNARRYVDRMHEGCRALLCTVNDILDFSKLEAGQVTIHPAPMSPSAVARGALDLFTPQAAAKDLSLSLFENDGGVGVSLDADRIRQVLLNLVGNAVKFTERGGVTLTVGYDKAAERLRFEVADTGPGVAADKTAQLFQRFSQIDGGLSRAGGAGLGLAICKGLVEAMGGAIGVESAPGAGSRFWFEVPAPRAELPSAGASRVAAVELGGLRLLVADDQDANRELVRLFLEPMGVEVTEAADGAEAYELAQAMPYDLILMDLRMPQMDGPSALAAIRAGEAPNDATPVLAYTAEAEDDPLLLARGFDGVVLKPVGATALLAAIRRALAPVEMEVADVA